MAEADNKELMQTLDDAWNAQDWDTFVARHAEDTVVYWPGQAEPTRGVHNHKAESIEFFKTFGAYLYQIYGNAAKLVGYAVQPDGSLDEIACASIPYNSPQGLAGF